MKRIAVISGGVRSAAIAAKADVINLLQPGSLDIVIFEPVEIGANWNGSNGYTDGRQRLCTEIERDLGFPYTTDLFPSSIDNQLVDDLMLKEYSWQAFNVGNGSAYPEWISRGGPPPTHYEFASYLRWVVVKTGFSVIPEMAQRLEFDTAQAKWTVITGSTRETDFDGVVVTGTRPRTDHYCLPASPLAPYIANTVDFWQRIPAIHDLLRDAANLHSVAVVGIVGAGAAAATITAHFLRRVCEIEDDPSKLLEIQLIGRSPFVAPRHPNYFQDRVFHDSTAWKAVPNKREFIDQALFGSVWTSLVDMISADTRVTTDTMAVRGARFLNPSYTARPATVVLEGDDPWTSSKRPCTPLSRRALHRQRR